MPYSWTTFPIGDSPKDWIRPGDEVSKSDFEDMDDDEFESLEYIGAIRDTPYPIPKDEKTGKLIFTGSPHEFALAQLAKLTPDQLIESIPNTFSVPSLQAQAKKALEESGFDPGPMQDEEAVEEATAKEENQPTRNKMPVGGAKVRADAKDKP